MSHSKEDAPPNDSSIPLSNLSKKVYRGKQTNKQKRSNRSNRSNDRDNTTFRISCEIAAAYRQYAKRSGKTLVECVERALVEDMKNNPAESVSLEIQQHIISSLPERRDVVRMRSVSRKLETFMSLIDGLNGKGDISKLEEKLLTWITRGTEVKNPTEEFVELLERAINYV